MLTESPLFLSEEEIKEHEPMPKNVAEAFEALERDSKWAQKTFGKDLLSFYTTSRKHEMEALGKMDEAERKRDQVQYF